ncbi:MAG: response regulator [Microbacterium sp.]|jgi:DNA-binding NarL/FixJ family response regulator|nr:response regulator [Microbacterium sp.]
MESSKIRRARIAIVEDHLLQRKRTEQLLNDTGEFEIVFSAVSAPEFVAWVQAAPRAERPHLLVLDLMVDRAPSVDVAVVESLLRAGLKIVVLSALASPPLVRSIVRAGVNGIVGKRDAEEDILDAIRAVLRGQEWITTELAAVIAGDPNRPKLSIQEERALILYASGLTIAEVSTAMNIGWETTRQYLDRVKSKYTAAGVPVRTKVDLGRVAVADGYIDLADQQRGTDASGS